MLQHSQPGACPLLPAPTLLSTQPTGPLLHIISVGLVHESKQKPVWTLMLVAEERIASPAPSPNSTAGVRLGKGALESVPLNAVQVCTYARRKPFTRYQLKATFIAANWEQLSGGNTKKTEQSETLGSKDKPHYYVFAKWVMSPAHEMYTKLCVPSLCRTVTATADPVPQFSPTLFRHLDEDVYDNMVL